mgnify:FL=1|jgi:hypothetical protein|tara:strand:- start:4215 stop:4757 length:543 start_codon:yes stop_codon:yes gene_type:complete
MTERRFWNRVGLHVTKNQALEWVDRVSSGPGAGEYLVDDVEEFSQVVAPGADSLTREIDRLFSLPVEDIEIKLDPLTASIHAAIEMENNKMTRLRELIAEGVSKAEAKETYQIEMGLLVADALDIDLDEYREKQAAMIADTMILDYENMTVAELKSTLKEKELPVSGKKADLITRLQESE